ncbi:DUF3889 domain-containing protein [Bacillus sp. PK3_68]|uniref:DUF3889 domain-containing protein n=1 Tax=Bacillus sp. PK3_68 TaxID=2027408 RepID=UPI000E72EDA1|nr:DUF3889 domain-containing protein [Bacillus sp. PK3_68]RJS60098.1 hypothetical protein CJ483_08510 [Bacillus sp. PK3_68]
MYKLLLSLLYCMVLIPIGLASVQVSLDNIVYAKDQAPSYAKWGAFAVQKAKQKYPNAAVIDYLHVGRYNSPDHSTEKFKLWLKENSREFWALVEIKYNSKTEQVIRITIRETVE